MSESRALRPKCASYSHTWNDKRGEKIFIAVIYDLATRSKADSFATPSEGLAAAAREAREFRSFRDFARDNTCHLSHL